MLKGYTRQHYNFLVLSVTLELRNILTIDYGN